jgi:uncharacterized membrane protein
MPPADRAHAGPLNPLHAAVLAGTVPLFLGALLADWAYSASFEIQWKNFASWLLVGGLAFTGLALLAALIGLLRGRRGRRSIVYVLLLVAAFATGLVDVLVHAKDAWASMPEGLILSAIVTLLVLAATGLGFSTLRSGVTP